MINVKDLAAKLTAYAMQYPRDEVMLQFDGDVAFEFDRGDTNEAMSIDGVQRFLVLIPKQNGKKLHLKGRE